MAIELRPAPRDSSRVTRAGADFVMGAITRLKHGRTRSEAQVPDEDLEQSVTAELLRIRNERAIELLQQWREEDSKMTPEEARQAEDDFEAFKEAVNESRRTHGERLIYP